MENLVTVRFDIWSALLAFGVFQGILFIIILLGFRNNKSKQYLIWMLLILILNLFNHLLLSTRLYLTYPHLLYLFTPTFYLLGPIYYWHVRSILDQSFSPKKVMLHLVPFLIAVIILLPFTTLPTDQKLEVLKAQQGSETIPMDLGTFLFVGLQIIQSFIYILFSATILKRKSQNGLTSKLARKISWLERFTIVFMAYWLVDFIGLIVYALFGGIHPEVFYVTTLSSALFINVLVFFAIKNNKEFNEYILNNEEGKYQNSSLNKEDASLILQKLEQFMVNEKPYLNAELSLPELAQLIKISPNQISQILNAELGKNFYEFVNEFRFEEVKSKLLQPDYKHYTILAIAFEAGFNNKNTFNKVFKRHSGITPSQYMKQHST